MRIILHSDDINLLQYWQNSIEENSHIVDTIKALMFTNNALIIINYSAFKGNWREFFSDMKLNNNRVLILHRLPNIDIAKELLTHGAKGYGNALMKDFYLHSAIETIKEGMVWLHPEFTTLLINDIESKDDKDLDKILITLTPREKEVAILLKDGNTYKKVASKLDITPRTVKAHTQHIYEKLNLKDRVGLALLLR